MWIKTMQFGYLNTDKIEKVRLRMIEDTFTDPEPLYHVTADLDNGAFHSLTNGVTKERANQLLSDIVHILSEVPERGSFQIPFCPPTE